MKIIKTVLLLSCCVFITGLSLITSNDFNQDLGRHLKLGEIILTTKQIPKINLFSYTNTNYPFINHHWLSEVIYYLFFSYFGQNSLIFLKSILIITSLFIIIKTFAKKTGWLPIIITTIVFSPLILERSDIRPELFGYLFFSIILAIVLSYPKSRKFAIALPLIMLLWVNIHISFVFGGFLIILFILKAIIKLRVTGYELKKIIVICLISLACLFINPNGLKGILYPLNIFRDYGYTIVENQNLFLLSRLTFNPLIKYFILISPLIIISFFVLVSINQLIEAVLLGVFFLLAIWQIRHFPFFVLAAIPTVTMAIKKITNRKILNVITVIVLLLSLFINVLLLSNSYFLVFDINKKVGVGFNEDGKQGVDFLIKNNLTKNIFNNFDIGGYLIYRLYPDHKLFIDNRPEGYPSSFIQKTYIGLQTNKQLKDEVFDKYEINTVFFSHTDQTPWGQEFLKNILKDEKWKLIYIDKAVAILSKENRFTDICKNKELFNKLIEKEVNYINLLRLARIFSFMEEYDLTELSLSKAQKLNPRSCAIKRLMYSQYQDSPYFYLGDKIKTNSFYCF